MHGKLPTMAYVIHRSDGRFEIRESVHTERGPRARTLATFRTLDDDVLDHAARRATRVFDRAVVVERAVERGAEYVPADTAALAASLIRSIATGGRLPATLAAALRHQIGDRGSLPDTIPPLIDWLGASLADRGDALRNLLRMTDRLPPPRRRGSQQYPRISSVPA